MNLYKNTTWKNYVITISLVIFSAFIALIFCEGIIRLVIYVNSEKSFRAVMRNLYDLKKEDDVTLGNIIQPSKYQKIIYELRPNIDDVYYCKGLLRTNKQGWRSDKNYEIVKDTNTIRIVGLGDSYMFGQGVNQGKDIMYLLEKKLNKMFPQKNWEVINTSVPGYNTVMEIETLEKKVLIFKPDIVIIEFIANDFDLPNFIYELNNWKDMKRFYLFNFIRKGLKLFELSFKLRDAPLDSDWGFERDPLKVPEQYRDMVGWKAYINAMMKLRELHKEHKFDVISFVTYKNKEVYDLSKRLEFCVGYNNAYNYNDPSLVLPDWHPSELGHEKNSEELLDLMRREKIIEKHVTGKLKMHFN